jgi:hypothetical protein
VPDLSASAAVPAVVALPHGLSRSLAVVGLIAAIIAGVFRDLAGAVAVRRRQGLQDDVVAVA